MIRPIIILMWCLHWLPFRALNAVGAALGMLLYLIAGDRRRAGAINLELCFPNLPAAERKRLLRRHFAEMGRVLLEYAYCWFAPAAQMRRLVHIEGLEHLAAQGNRPVILFAAHFVNLELAGIRLSMDVPIINIFSHQKHRGLDSYIEQKRLRFNTGLLVSRQDGVRPLLRALRKGYHIYYLPDQDLGPRESVFVPFFGVPAATITGLSRLAQITGAVVLPCMVRRRRDGYTLRLEPPLANFPTADPVADAARMNAELETRIRERPSEYFWLHKRFKTRPSGEPRFY